MTEEETFNHHKRLAIERAKLRTEKQGAIADEAEAVLAHYIKASIEDDTDMHYRLKTNAKMERQLADTFESYETQLGHRYYGDWTTTWDED